MFNKQNIQDIYKLAPIQAGIYYHWLSERETAVYIGQSSYRFHGELRLDLVQQALNTIFERHAILRTIYTHKKTDDILQIVLKKRPVDVAKQDLRHLPADERDRYIESYLVSDRHRPFDLNRDAPMRLAALQSDERVYDLVWTNHHIAVDGWCLGILISEFFTCYNALVAHKPHALAPAGQYGQFVQWLNEQPQATAASYWNTYLTDVDKPTGLPVHTTTPTNDYVPDEQVLTLSEADTTQLHTLAEQNRLTVSCLLQASWSLLLARYNDTDRVVFGLVSSVRPPVIAGVDRMVGPLINTLPIAPVVDQTASLLTLATYLQTQRVEGDQYSYMPLSSIQAAHPLGNQLLDHVFVFENFPVSQLLGQRDLVAGIDQIEARSSFAQTNYNLNLIVLPEQQLSVLVNYNQAVYRPTFISQVVADFQAIIAQLLATPDAALRTIRFPSAQPAPVIASEEADCAVGLSLPTFFRQTANRLGNRPALVDQTQSITYADLSAQVDRLAGWLRQEGVQSGDVIGVCLERSADWVLAVLAIWQAGGVYLPLLPTLPLERQRHMLSDSRCRFGIGDSPAFGGAITVLSMAEGHAYAGPIVPTDVLDTQTAYIIYTSGTSGLPKGVPLRHESLMCRALDHGNWLQLTETDVVLQSASISFDASLMEVTMAMLAGATLAIAEEAIKTNTDALTSWLALQGVTTAIFSPAYLRLLNRHPLPTVRNIITTGEAASLPDVLHYAATKAVFNGYGPTETCVGATYHRVDATQADRYAREGGIPIGKPFAHTAIYLLNQAGEPVPTGCVGELCVTGIGLAEGYLNDDARTAEKFMTNPHARWASERRLYRTGDLGYVTSSGDLQYIGRADDQIQLHGVRVEPKEIEAVFRTHDAITEAVVLFDRKTTQLRIALQSETLTSYTDELRTWASTCLPAHMIPSEGIVLAHFPLTASGKIDKRQLLMATPEETDDALVVERILLPEATQQLMAVFADLLGKATVKPTDHFFRLGGDSIKAIQIVSRMHRLGYQLDVQTIFKHPIIDDLASQLSRVAALIEQAPAQGSFPLTPILASFANQPRHNPNHFNQALLLVAHQPLQAFALQAMLDALRQHHDALRLRLDNPRQATYTPFTPLALDTFDLRQHPQPATQLTYLANQLQASLDLATGQLLRLAHFRLPDGDRLLLVIHHLAVDGLSWRILLEDAQRLYQQALLGQPLGLPARSHSFGHWAKAWQQAVADGLLADQNAHWQQLVDEWSGQPLGLPSGQGSGSGQVVLRLSAELTDGLLRDVPAAYGNHIQETLLTGLLLSWQALTGAGAVLLELEGHGREGLVSGLDVSRTVGWFTSLYPVELSLSSSSVGRSLKEVKEQLRSVPHHGVGWGWWQQQTGSSVSAGVLFNYLGQFDSDLKGGLWALGGEDYGLVEGADEAVYGPPLRLISGVVGGELEVSVRYERGLVDEAWVVALVAGYERALAQVVAHCQGQGERELTPSDLSYSQLFIDQLAQLETHVSQQYGAKLADVVQLAPLQEGMAFAYLRQPNTTAYSYQLAYRLTGDVAMTPLTNAINQLMERHAVLRTAFDYEQMGELVQLILTNRQPALTYTDICFETAEQQQAIIAGYKQRDRERGFDIVRDVLFRIALFKTADQQVELVWSCHHLIMDGWSMGVLMADFLHCYESQIHPSATPMLPAPQYRDYVQWVKQQDQTAATGYWQTYLSGYDTPIQLPRRTYTNEPETAFQYESLRLALPAHVSQSLLAFGQANDLSVSQMLTTLWGLLMARYTNAQDVVFGEVMATRPPELAGAEQTVGLFLNTLPVRIRFAETDTLTDLMARAKADRLAATRHSYLPLSVIQTESMLGSELINQLFIVENYPVETSLSDAPSTQWVIDNVSTTEHTDYDLAVDVKLGASLEITLKYNAAVYDAAFVGQLQTHYEHLIRQFVVMPEAPLRRVGLLTADEKVQLTYWGADADEIRTPDPAYLTAFDAQVTRTPYAPALLDGLHTVDYRTLQRRSVQIANYLQHEVDVQPGDVVGVYMHRSAECIACLLGIMRAGAAFLPIDLSYPIDRVRYMLNQAGTKVALTAVDYLPALQEAGCYTVATEVIPHVDGALSAQQQAPAIADSRTAYVIFTSGSTGQPKGAQLSQRNLMNYLRYVNRTYALGRDGFPMGWFTSVAFDLSITTLLAPLLRGDSIRIFHDDEPLHDVLTTVFGEASALTMVKLTPAHVGLLNHLPITYTNITCAVVGGEELQPEHVRTLWRLNPAMRIYNEYGPTETTVGCVVNRVGDETDTRAVGKPIDNTRLYILDAEHRMVPVGVTGELFIGGAGVGKGYINQPEQTAQRFIANPYGGTDWLYATGDQARWLPDGRVDYVGRKDNQLKINGFRIETGEIEHQLARIEGVREACVLGLDRPQTGKWLVAYVVKSTTATELTEEGLQQRLLAFLPAHMIPEAVLFLDEIPLTVNGKIDRRALPTPAARSELVAYVAPETPNERLLAEVLETILAQPQIGCTDNLLRLGLDSIRSVQVMAKLAQRGYDLSVATMFEQPYLGEWARHLSARIRTEPVATAPIQTERVSADDLELIEALFN